MTRTTGSEVAAVSTPAARLREWGCLRRPSRGSPAGIPGAGRSGRTSAGCRRARTAFGERSVRSVRPGVQRARHVHGGVTRLGLERDHRQAFELASRTDGRGRPCRANPPSSTSCELSAFAASSWMPTCTAGHVSGQPPRPQSLCHGRFANPVTSVPLPNGFSTARWPSTRSGTGTTSTPPRPMSDAHHRVVVERRHERASAAPCRAAGTGIAGRSSSDAHHDHSSPSGPRRAVGRPRRRSRRAGRRTPASRPGTLWCAGSAPCAPGRRRARTCGAGRVASRRGRGSRAP